MKRFISFVVFLVVLTICVGFFRGWFSLSTNKELLGNKIDVNFKVDRDKINDDATALKENTKSMIGSASNDK